MGFTSITSKHHNELVSAMLPFRGRELTTAEIKECVEECLGGQIAQWVHPSDHCSNHTCKGACECACGNTAVFDRLKRGLYRVR